MLAYEIVTNIKFLTSSESWSLGVIAPSSVLGFFTVGLKKASRVRFLDMMIECTGQSFQMAIKGTKNIRVSFLSYYVRNTNY
jgi:hypothetical protein